MAAERCRLLGAAVVDASPVVEGALGLGHPPDPGSGHFDPGYLWVVFGYSKSTNYRHLYIAQPRIHLNKNHFAIHRHLFGQDCYIQDARKSLELLY